MKYTKKNAKETLNSYKDMTGYFDGSITQGFMFDMLRHRMGFGDAEARVIIAALTLSGAKFKI